MQSVLEIVKETIQTTSPVESDTSNIQEDSWLVEYGFDSVNSLELIMALEEQFDIEIEDEHVVEIQTVKDIVVMIESYIEANQGNR